MTYESATNAYINQHIADIIPINLILFSSSDKNDIMDITDNLPEGFPAFFYPPEMAVEGRHRCFFTDVKNVATSSPWFTNQA